MRNRLTPLFHTFRKSLAVRILLGLIVFYFLFSWFAINSLAKSLLPWVAENKLASQASVEKVTFDPLRLTATIDHFKLTEKDGKPLASFDKLVVDLEASGLFHWAWKLKQVALTAPNVNVSISKQGKFNWADLIAKLNEDPSPPEKDLPRVIIERISIAKGDIEYLDANHPAPLQASLTPLDFELEGFSTLPKDRGDYLIAAKLPYQGGTLKWKGNFGVNPLASQGTLAIEGLQIAKVMQWVKTQPLPLQAEAGTFSSQFKYDFSLVNEQPKLVLSDTRLAINNLAGKLPQGDHIGLKQVELRMKSLLLKQQPHLAISSKEIAIKLDQFELQKPQAVFTLANANLNLPELALQQKDNTQLTFQDLNLQLSQLQLQHQQHTLFQLPEFNVEQVSLNLAERQVNIAKISLANGQLSATSHANGTLDWQQIFTSTAPEKQAEPVTDSTEKPETETKEAEPFKLAINEIALSHWQLNYLDQQFAKPLQAAIADFNLQWALEMDKEVSLTKLQAEANQLNVQSDKKTVAQLGKLSLADGNISLAQQKVTIGAIRLSELKTSVSRQADQHLNWQIILAPVNKTAAATAASSAQPSESMAKPSTKKTAWAVALKQFSLQHANIHIEDLSTPTPVGLDITDGKVEVAGISQNMTKPLAVKAGFKVKQGGQFTAQGKLSPAPFKADLQLSLTDFSLKPFAPYVQQVALLQLQDGAANIQGKLHQTSGGSTRFDGGFSVNQWSLVEESSQQPFLRWEKLQGDGLALSLAPNKLQLNTLTLSKPQTKFIIYPDRSLNISKVMRNPAPTPTPAEGAGNSTATPASTGKSAVAGTPAETNQPSDFPVNIDTVRINGAELEFADLSLPQPFGTNIHSLGGVINGISSNPASTGQVELDGKVDEYGSARIRGSLQPFKTTEFTDIKLAFTNLEMNRLTPYSGKFAGRKIESGKLSVDLEYKIKQRKLAGENKFVIQKLTLGEKVDSKDAANLPLDLAIAILEDSNGVIDLDLPISGSLDDPKFSYGSILWKAFTNVLTKIVTAPFSALGKLFGSSEKLEAVLFEPGKSAISPPELEKLHAISSALGKRQQLKLGVIPGYDSTIDTRAIQEITLRKQVAEEIGTRLEAGQPAGPIDLNNPKVQTAIQALHDRLTNKGLLKRLAAKLEKAPAGFHEQAQEALTTSIQVSEADLQALAKARAEAILKVIHAAGISSERVEAGVPAGTKADRDQVPSKLTLDVIKH